MRRLRILPLLLAVLLLTGCANDPLPEIYTKNVLSGADGYTVGSEDYPYTEGWFTELHLDGPTTLYGDGKAWIELRPDLDFSTVRANGKPTHVSRGVFEGFSLPVYAADNEELYFDMRIPNRWSEPAWSYLQDVGDEPGQAGTYANSLYIPSEATDEVYVYDGETFSVSGTVGDRPLMALEFDSSLYVSCYGDDTVWVYDGSTWALSGNVGGGPVGLAEYDGNLYVACLSDDEIWRYSGGVWAVDPALGAGGVAGAVGTSPEWMLAYDGDLYVGCGGVDDDVWIRSGGAWAKDDDVDGDPQVFHEHDGDLYLNCYTDDTVWVKSGGVWAVATNVQTDIGNAPIGLEEFNGNLYSACIDSVWANISDFWNENSDFTEVTADEPMFFETYEDKLYCICKDGDGVWVYEQETAYMRLHAWLASAQVGATDAFRMHMEYENFTAGTDVVPGTGSDVRVETLTGVAARYQSYLIVMPLDMTGVQSDDNMGFLLRRIASSDEIAGEVVVNHLGLLFLCDKLGDPAP